MADTSSAFWPPLYIHLCTHIWISWKMIAGRMRQRRLAAEIRALAADIPPEQMAVMLAGFVAWRADATAIADQRALEEGGPQDG